ncbi:hypothetical protein HY635_04065 [Candidatus Uhrbacteria bacterium]|nr:hypothetical protein [Candidatus Uhrbacteria bacterium]
MKVIKKGRPQKGWTKELKCTGEGNGDGGCGAKLLVEEGDLFRTESHALNETDYYITFRCPNCNALTDIDDRVGNISAHELPHYSAWRKRRRRSAAPTP